MLIGRGMMIDDSHMVVLMLDIGRGMMIDGSHMVVLMLIGKGMM